jgi:predicted SAM-dependent methyltransferase
MLKLNLGCGLDIRPGYDNIDKFVAHPQAIRGDVEDLSPLYRPGTVDEIVAQDILEHIPFARTQTILAHWASLLKVGGRIIIRSPDLDKQIECYQRGVWSHHRFIHMMFGGQTHPGNFHYNAFSARDLVGRLRAVGLEPVHVRFIHDHLVDDETSFNANLEVVAYKGVTISLPAEQSQLHDLLAVTPICTEFPGSVIRLSPAAQPLAGMFDHLARVELIDRPAEYPQPAGEGTVARAKLRALGREQAPCFPRMAFTQQEIDQARQWLGGRAKPVVLVTDTTSRWNATAQLDDAAWQQIIERLRQSGATPLHLSVAGSSRKLEGVTVLPPMGLRQLAACFLAIGRFVGVDGGEMHLMLAAGGRAIALAPPASAEYDPARWQYGSPSDWGPSPVRAKYIPLSEHAAVGEHLSFLDAPPGA